MISGIMSFWRSLYSKKTRGSPHKNPPVCPTQKKIPAWQHSSEMSHGFKFGAFFSTPQNNPPSKKIPNNSPKKSGSSVFFFKRLQVGGAGFAELQREKPEEARSRHKSSIGASCPFLPRQGVRSLLQKTWGFFGWIFGKQSNGSMVSLEWIHALPVFFPSSQSGVGFRLDWTLKNGYVRSKKVWSVDHFGTKMLAPAQVFSKLLPALWRQ